MRAAKYLNGVVCKLSGRDFIHMFFIYYWKEEGQGIRVVLELEG